MTLEPGDVRVFISYSHEDDSHNLGVQAMAAKLVELGFSVFLDARREIPPNSWSELIERELPRADVVLCVCTPTYAERVDGEVPGGQGRGVAQEAALVRAEAYDQKMRADRFWVVHLEGSDLVVPKVLGGTGTHCFRWPSDRDGLAQTLRAPTKRRRIVDALGEVFDDDVEALQEWARRFVPLGRDTVLDFDDRALRVANGLLTHRDPAVTKQALQSLVIEQRELAKSLEGVARALGLGALVGKTKRARDPAKPESGSVVGLLETAYSRREELRIKGQSTEEVDREILDLKRRQRRGMSLKKGEFLEDGRFRLVEIIGRGGFATVWKAYDRVLDQLVAVKVLHGQFEHSEERRERMFRGAQRMAKLRHPNVARVLVPMGEEQGIYYYVMEYAAGGDLRRAVLEQRIDTETALGVIEQVADALAGAHSRGLTHRDVKPENILLREDGTPALTDFDLVQAKDTTGGTRTGALGTVLYAAPEQNEDASRVDHRVDVFGLGMTGVFCMHGEKLPSSAMYKRDAFLASLGCSAAVRKVLARAAALEVEERYPDMVSFAAALREARTSPRRVEVGEPRTVSRIIEAPRSGVELVRIPAGRFLMGSPEGEEGRKESYVDDVVERLGFHPEGPQHAVELKAFYLAKTPVTNAQYRRFLESAERPKDVKDPKHWDDSSYNQDDQPVVGISWHEAKAYCEWAGLSLPTEAQWEYACRAGTTTQYWAGDDDKDLARAGWYSGNSEGRLHPVGEKPANPWGLHDMHGNVFEWCQDAFESYATSPRAGDGLRKEPVGDAYRVIRGGSFGFAARFARSAFRSYYPPFFRWGVVGFRPAQGHHQ